MGRRGLLLHGGERGLDTDEVFLGLGEGPRVAEGPADALLRADEVPLDVITHVGEVVVSVVGEMRETMDSETARLFGVRTDQTGGLSGGFGLRPRFAHPDTRCTTIPLAKTQLDSAACRRWIPRGRGVSVQLSGSTSSGPSFFTLLTAFETA